MRAGSLNRGKSVGPEVDADVDQVRSTRRSNRFRYSQSNGSILRTVKTKKPLLTRLKPGLKVVLNESENSHIQRPNVCSVVVCLRIRLPLGVFAWQCGGETPLVGELQGRSLDGTRESGLPHFQTWSRCYCGGANGEFNSRFVLPLI